MPRVTSHRRRVGQHEVVKPRARPLLPTRADRAKAALRPRSLRGSLCRRGPHSDPRCVGAAASHDFPKPRAATAAGQPFAEPSVADTRSQARQTPHDEHLGRHPNQTNHGGLVWVKSTAAGDFGRLLSTSAMSLTGHSRPGGCSRPEAALRRRMRDARKAGCSWIQPVHLLVARSGWSSAVTTGTSRALARPRRTLAGHGHPAHQATCCCAFRHVDGGWPEAHTALPA